ncbi:MAG: alpha/beta hydrolase [Nocardioides sp.]|nr:alpha/beta hydrolase [Nocardioides sp.]
MNLAGRVIGAVAGAVGVAVVGTTAGVVRQGRVIGRRVEDSTPFGSLRSSPLTLIADDGVPLHVEVDEVGDAPRGAPGSEGSDLTVVFVHGFALNMDCWHFQRAAYRGLVRAVYYDQRSHGRSGRSGREGSTIEQLALDLAHVLMTMVPDGPVVLVGHSMGGMTIVALADQHPELFGEKVVGVVLVSTTAGGLDPSRMLLPMLPARLSGGVAGRTVSTLAIGHRVVDGVRRLGASFAQVATDVFAFGGAVPAAYVDFVDEMLAATPFEVVAQFFPSFKGLDKFHAVEVLSRVPTAIIAGTGDRLTSVGHSRKLHQRIAGSTLLECEDAGHMVILERHGQVNAALDQLLTAAVDRSTST